MDTHCPACGAGLEHSLELTEEERLRAVVRSELAMAPTPAPVVITETIEVPVETPAPSEDALDDVEDAIEELAGDLEDVTEELAGDVADELDAVEGDALDALDEPEPEPAPPSHEDAEPARGHFLGRKVFG